MIFRYVARCSGGYRRVKVFCASTTTTPFVRLGDLLLTPKEWEAFARQFPAPEQHVSFDGLDTISETRLDVKVGS